MSTVRAAMLGMLAGLHAIASPAMASAAELRVVASFSVIADMVRVIGGGDIQLSVLAGVGEDVHAYQPTPGDVRALAQARLIVVNGLGLETWMDHRLIRSSGTQGTIVVASDGVKPIPARTHRHDPREAQEQPRQPPRYDPHAWHSLTNGRIYIANISRALAQADPAGAARYRERAQAYDADLARAHGEVRTTLDRLPSWRRRIVTSHLAFAYFGEAYNLTFYAPHGNNAALAPADKSVAKVTKRMKYEAVQAAFEEYGMDPALLQQVVRDGGGQILGTLYADTLSPPGGPADSYLKMVRCNAGVLVAALLSN
jgi:zinc/manganese transport system substrate-binding protein